MKKNLLLLSFMIVLAAITSKSFANFDENSCREHIVQTALLYKITLDKETLGKIKFSDLGLTSEMVNNLSSEEQEEIYEKIKPLKTIANDYYESIKVELKETLEIAFYYNAYQIFEAKIEELRAIRNKFEAVCSLSK